MTTLILYGSETKLTNSHKIVTCPKRAYKQPEYYVRVKVYPGDVVEAMTHSKPLKGEMVLNTVEVS